MNPEPAVIISQTSLVTSRICGQPTPDGDPCKNHTTSWFEQHGWRCRFHVPEGMSWPHARRGVSDLKKDDITQPLPALPTEPPNDGRITDIKTALDAIAWATENLMSGAFTESRSRGIINGARQYMRGIATTEGSELMEKLEKAASDLGGLPKQK